MFYALANFISPLVGTAMYEKWNFRITCDYTASFTLAFGLICFIFNCGFNVLSENREFNRKLEDLKERAEQLQKPQDASLSKRTASINRKMSKRVFIGDADFAANQLGYRKAILMALNDGRGKKRSKSNYVA